VTLTGFSWFILGIWYGIGYCPCTGWHWQVKEKLGQFDMPNSYVKFLVDSITGLDLNANLVDISTLLVFIMALLTAIYTNFRDWRISKFKNKIRNVEIRKEVSHASKEIEEFLRQQ
jgi:hypothetical protein